MKEVKERTDLKQVPIVTYLCFCIENRRPHKLTLQPECQLCKILTLTRIFSRRVPPFCFDLAVSRPNLLRLEIEQPQPVQRRKQTGSEQLSTTLSMPPRRGRQKKTQVKVEVNVPSEEGK